MSVIEVMRVKFKWPGKIFEFTNPHNLSVKKDDFVVVETDRGETKVGVVAIAPRVRVEHSEDKHLNGVLRLATEQDKQLEFVNDEFRVDVKQFFTNRVQGKEINGVRMVDCEKLDAGRKMIVYYQSENKRFDVKGVSIEISKKFNMKVDMRSVGIRDGARLAGGIGKCGLSLCCSTWLPDFKPVSIRMAKDQGLSPEPEGITGQCGRLLCCLGYEHENYVEMGKGLPKVGKVVVTPAGEGRVVKLDILKGALTVRTEEGKIEVFQNDEVTRKFAPQVQNQLKGKKKTKAKPKAGPKVTPNS